MIIKIRWDCSKSGIGHDRVAVFTGPDADHLANVGVLTLHRDEAVAFRRSICQGSGIEGSGGFTGILESGWAGDDD